MTAFTKETHGLILHENWEGDGGPYPDPVVGNGWVEEETVDTEWELTGLSSGFGNVRWTTSETTRRRLHKLFSGILTGDFIIYELISTGNSSESFRLGIGSDSDEYYLFVQDEDDPSGFARLTRASEGELDLVDPYSRAGSFDAYQLLHIADEKRLIVLDDPSVDTNDPFYSSLSFSEILNGVYTGDEILLDRVFIDARNTAFAAGSRNFRTLYICGRELVVTGLPSGWKIRIDSYTPITEDGSGEVRIDPTDLGNDPFPFTEIRVLNESDVIQETLTPADSDTPAAWVGGIWGGDEYLYNQTPLQPTLTTGFILDDRVELIGSAFSDPEDDEHTATQVQIDVTGGDYSSPVYDSGAVGPVTTAVIGGLTEDTDYIARIRYQDEATRWSPYSADAAFTTADVSWTIQDPDPGTAWVDFC